MALQRPLILTSALALSLAGLSQPGETARLRFAVTYRAGQGGQPLDGRLLLIISADKAEEPRFQISDVALRSQQIFGVDVDGWKPGQEAVFEGGVLGFPVRSIAELPAGRYHVQALLHRYETFRRADGHVVKLPMDRGEGQQWSKAPGNLYSTPREIAIDPAHPETIRIELDQVIPPIADPPTTKYVKHEKLLSERLSKFWGRPMYLGANILLPEGFDTHPNARYPLVINHGHFPYDLDGFRDEPPDPNLKPEVLRALPPRGLQPHRAGVRQRVLQGLDGARLSPLPPRRDPARQPVLRRLLRRELPEPRPLRRRHHLRAHPLPREEIPRPRRGLGALHVRRLDGRLGGPRGPGHLSRRVQRLLGRVSGPHRLPRIHRRQHLRGRERVLLEGAVGEHRDAVPPRLPRPPLLDGRALQPARARSRHEEPLGRAVGHLGGRLLPGRARRVPEAHLGQEHRGHRQDGRGILEGELRPRPHPAPGLGKGPRQEARRQDPHLRRRAWTTTT